MFLLVQFVSAGEIKRDLNNLIENSIDNEKIPVIISFKDKPSQADINIIKLSGADIKYRYSIIDAIAVKLPVKAIKNLEKNKFISTIEPDYEMEISLDASADYIQADDVWNLNLTGKNIDVAILDTGIHDEHPSLNVEMEVDFTGEGTDDLNGHGTHVAGIVASKDPIYKGVAYDSDLYNVKVMTTEGGGYASDIIQGIEWSVNNGAEIISMSLSSQLTICDGTDSISRAVDNAVDNGVIVVVAAGNWGFGGNGTVGSPGCAEKALTVGSVSDGSAFGDTDYIPSWSGKGPTYDGRVKPDLVAPGVSIISTWNNNGFVIKSGTSMSTPHVSAIAALLLEADQDLNSDEIKDILKESAIDLGYDENIQGAGKVNVYEALSNLVSKVKPSDEVLNLKLTKDGDDLNILSGEITAYERINGEENFRIINGSDEEIIYKGNLFYEKDNLALFLGDVLWGDLVLNGLCYSNLPSFGVKCSYVRNDQEGEDINFYEVEQEFNLVGPNSIMINSFEIAQKSKKVVDEKINLIQNSSKLADLNIKGEVIDDKIFFGEFFIKELDVYYNEKYLGMCFFGDVNDCYLVFEGRVL